KMKTLCPGTINGFMGMFGKIMGEGNLSVKEKELIALAIGVASSCTPCIRLHVQKCKAAGATKEEMIEAASVAVMMAGGPAFTHIPAVIDAIEALEA
ncbi:MAG: carboxymuconolactone decarboxylase family protein, partial [Planctomycetes bacterium]|nr:carboxymuconolactone decarboxylase family protein [Planctomycetota bacterium]